MLCSIYDIHYNSIFCSVLYSRVPISLVKKIQPKMKHFNVPKFLVADKRLYKRLCPSVRPSVGWSVGPWTRVEKWGKHAFPPLPTRPRLVLAVYPALFKILNLSSLKLVLIKKCTSANETFNAPTFCPKTDFIVLLPFRQFHSLGIRSSNAIIKKLRRYQPQNFNTYTRFSC